MALALALSGLIAAGVVWFRAPDDQAVRSTRGATTTAQPSGPTSAAPGTAALAPTTVARSPAASTTSVATTLRGGAPVRPGTWGGRGIKVVLTGTGGSVEYECATGVLSAPLVASPSGSFEVVGTYTVLRGGPPDPAAPAPRAQPARYSGSVDGLQMRLTVSLPESGTMLGPFSLGFDQQPLIDRCG